MSDFRKIAKELEEQFDKIQAKPSASKDDDKMIELLSVAIASIERADEAGKVSNANWGGKDFDVERWLKDERSDKCEHVEADPSLATVVLSEDDSFGPVGRFIVCQECEDKNQEEEDNVHVRCADCRESKPRKEVAEWRWYDFYADQGDVPLNICNDCWDKPTHQGRKAKDSNDRDDEFPPEEEDEDDDWYRDDNDYAKDSSSTVVGGDVEALAALASSFYATAEPDLVKEAEQIDDVLMQISNPKYAIAKLKLVYDSDLEKLREDGRAEQIELKYRNPKKHLDEMYGNKAIASAVEKKVERYRPLQAPLSTRYSPDHPGTQMMRITDRVYQDPITGKIYNYANGYTTDKGAEIPGGGVDQQIQDINTHQSRSMFTTREGMFSNASTESEDN